MAKHNYISCDICGNIIYGTEKTIDGFRYKFKKFFNRRTIDICDNCIKKLYVVSDDIKCEEKISDEVIKKYNDKYSYDNVLASIYLEGAEDAIKCLNQYRMRIVK